MNVNTSRRTIGRQWLCAAAAVALLGACTTTSEDRSDLVASARAALDSLYRQTPAARSLADNSVAILVFPTVTQGGLTVGVQYGRGVLFRNGSVAGYYNIAGGSFGLQIGVQSFSQAYFFTTEEAYQTFQNTEGFEVGAGLDFAVADVGASGEISSSTLQKPLVVFVWGQQGLMAGIKVEGQKITRLESE